MKRDYLTIAEIAEDLGVSYRQAYLLIRREIPHYRVSLKDTRVPAAEFKAWKNRSMRVTRPPKRRKA